MRREGRKGRTAGRRWELVEGGAEGGEGWTWMRVGRLRGRLWMMRAGGGRGRAVGVPDRSGPAGKVRGGRQAAVGPVAPRRPSAVAVCLNTGRC